MKNHTKNEIQNTKYQLTLGWLYPELMSTYGDRGNIYVLQKIAEANGIDLEVLRINQTHNASLITRCDLLFMGGAQDLQQEIVSNDLMGEKGKKLRQLIENGVPGLYICGAFQFLGHYYIDSYDNKIPGLGVFDMFTKSYKTKPRLIGNIVIQPSSSLITNHQQTTNNYFVGYENHGGRTYLADKSAAFAKVIKGFGNNGDDQTEGIIYKNSIGTYLHGPILPSNPEMAIQLLKKAYENRYDNSIDLKFDTTLATTARDGLLKRLKSSY